MTIGQLLGELEQACEGDRTTGGCLLAQAARECELPDSEVSRTLLREILVDYRRERQLSDYGLFIQESSPREHFAQLPGDPFAEWSPLAAPTGLTAHKREIDNWQARSTLKGLSVLMAVKDGYRRLSSALYTLAEDLRHSEAETQGWQITFHVCVNFTDDNSLYELDKFAKTLARALRINVREYFLESPQRLGGSGAKTWTKTSALNLLLADCDEHPLAQSQRHFLHFADDDIKVHVGDLVVSRNIAELERTPEAWIVGATYSDSQPRGFARVTTVRKDPCFLKLCGDRQLVNIYGGAMTTTRFRLQNLLGKDFTFPTVADRSLGEDAYLTICGNWDHIQDRQKPLRVYTLMSNLVEHSEEVSVGGWARRIRRDRSWGKDTFEHVRSQKDASESSQVTYDEFAMLRRNSFAQVGEQIENHANERDHLAHRLGAAFRRLAKESEAAAEFVAFRPSTGMTHYHVCHTIVHNKRVFDDLATTLESLPIGAELAHLLRASKGHPGRHFPEICRRLVELDRSSAEPGLLKNPFLYNLYEIAEEATAIMAQFLRSLGANQTEFFGRPIPSDQALGRLERRYPLNLKDLVARLVHPHLKKTSARESDWKIEGHYLPGDVPTSRSFSAYLQATPSGEGGENSAVDLFLRYFPCPGIREFFEISPRRRVYLQVLGRQLVSSFWSPEDASTSRTRIRLPEILYPDLTEAAANCLGPQQWTPAGRFSQSLWIEQSLRGRTAPLSTTLMSDEWAASIAEGLGSSLGGLHGATIQIRKQLEKVLLHDPKDRHFALGCELYGEEFFSLILKHVDQLRVFKSEAYEDWLTSGASRSRDVQRLLEADDSQGEVLRRTRQIFANSGSSVERMWKRLCRESASVHESHGALGHLGVFRRNLRIGDRSQSEPIWQENQLGDGTKVWIVPPEAKVQELYLANHSGIAMVDPALEGGLAVADILAARLAASTLGARLRGELREQRGAADAKSHWEMDDSSLSLCWDRFINGYAQRFREAAGRALVSRPEEGRAFLEALLGRMNLFGAIFLLAQLHDRFEYDLDTKSREWAARICIDLFNRTTRPTLRFRTERG